MTAVTTWMRPAGVKYQLQHVREAGAPLAAQQYIEQWVQNEVQHDQAICYFVENFTDCTSRSQLCQQNRNLKQKEGSII
jgi:hypothetical protein